MNDVLIRITLLLCIVLLLRRVRWRGREVWAEILKPQLLSHGLAREYTLSPGTHIQDIINAAHDGDVIILKKGTYTGNITFSGKTITVRSRKPNNWNVIEKTILVMRSDPFFMPVLFIRVCVNPIISNNKQLQA